MRAGWPPPSAATSLLSDARGAATTSLPGGVPSRLARRHRFIARATRRIGLTRFGPVYLIPGRVGSCVMLRTRLGDGHGTVSFCRANRMVERGQLAFTFAGSTDREMVVVLLPDGSHRLRLLLANDAPGRPRRVGNTALAYTSYALYRGGTLRWADRRGRQRRTVLPYEPASGN
jgi:hypothetical protein